MNNKEKYYLTKYASSSGPNGDGPVAPTPSSGGSSPFGSSGPNGDGLGAPPSVAATQATQTAAATAKAQQQNASTVTPTGTAAPQANSAQAMTPAPQAPQLSARDKWMQDRANAAGASAIGSYNKRYGDGAWSRLDTGAQASKMKGLLGSLHSHYTGG